MLIELRLPGETPRRWKLRLAEQLAALGDVEAQVRWIETRDRPPPCVDALLAFDRIARGPLGGGWTMVGRDAFARFRSAPERRPDLILDFCGPAESTATPTWSVTYDGAFGEAAALDALLGEASPAIEIIDVAANRLIASARVGCDMAGSLRAALENVLSQTGALIAAAVAGRGSSSALERAAVPRAGCLRVARFVSAELARGLRRRLYHITHYAPHWRVGWRVADGPDVIDLRAHPATGWTDLPDDGFHFYADPFPFIWRGRAWLFVEDYDHRVGRGVISVAEFDRSGPRSAPQPVLSAATHLSYPFVFEHEGEVWMVPESGAARCIDLFRAENFPFGWRCEARLVADVVASDATLFRRGDLWWMMATVRADGGSFSDSLHLWSAPRPQGPWTPHRRNPVLIDAGAARPAGRMVERGGRLIRPVQDCRAGYGAALALAVVTRLDAQGFEQRVETILRPGPLWPGRRLHTLNRAGWLECVDGSAHSLKAAALWRGARAPDGAEAAQASAWISRGADPSGRRRGP